MKLFNNLSISLKIIFLIVFVAVFFIFISLLATTIYNLNHEKNILLENVRVQGKLTNEYCVAALNFDYKNEAKEYLSKLRVVTNIQEAILFDSQGEIFATYENPSNIKSIMPSFRKESYYEFSGQNLFIFEPVVESDVYFGTLFIKTKFDFIKLVKQHVIMIFLMILTLAAMSFLLARYLQKFITTPLFELEHTMGRIAKERDYSVFLPKRSEQDEISSLISSFNEMLNQIKIHENKLKASENLQKKIAENYPNSYLTIIEKGLTLSFTSGGEYKNQNLNPNDYIGLNIEQIFNENASFIIEKYQKAFQGEEISFEMLINSIHLQFTVIPLFDDSNNIERILSVAENITERKINEEKIKNQNVVLEKAVREKERQMAELMEENLQQEKLAAIGQVSGNIAHEIRNPLGAIKQSVFFLKRKMDEYPQKIQEHLNIIDKEMNNANKVIKNMLTTTRISRANNQYIDLKEILNEASVRNIIDKKSINFFVDLNPLPFLIFADPINLRQVIVNILHNAVHAISDEGTISIIGIYVKENEICKIEFLDDGKGMSEETLAKIFKPLFTTKTQGTGLGMGICKQVIENIGGTIEVTSKLNHGTRVLITLPMKS